MSVCPGETTELTRGRLEWGVKGRGCRSRRTTSYCLDELWWNFHRGSNSFRSQQLCGPLGCDACHHGNWPS